MKKPLLALLFSLSFFAAISQTTVTGSLTAASPVFNRPSSLTTLSSVGTAVYYSVLRLQVAAPGSITIDCVSTFLDGGVPDSYGLLYSGPFNPASPLTNLVGINDDKGTSDYDFAITYSFPAAGTYFVVVTTYSNAITGGFTVTTTGGVLPVSLKSFTAERVNRSMNEVKWSTAQEQNVAKFQIERSADGKKFTDVVNTVMAKNSITGGTYAALDDKAMLGLNYYRLKTIDRDGQYSYSAVVLVNNKNAVASIKAFPNPATNVLKVQVPEDMTGNISFTIINLLGLPVQTVQKQLLTGEVIQLDVQNLPKGAYQLKVSSTKSSSTVSFIK